MKINLKKLKVQFLIVVLLLVFLGLIFNIMSEINSEAQESYTGLPEIEQEEGIAEVIYQRQSEREFAQESLSQEDIGHLLWAGEGISVDGVSGPTRTSPSAGATNPLELYLLAENVEGLSPGIYKYNIEDHDLELKTEGEKARELGRAALGQRAVAEAPGVVIVAANYERTTSTYGERGIRYVHIEAGHAGQNICLMAEEKNLGSVIIGAFEDEGVKDIIGAEAAEPLLLIPVGK